MLLFAINSFTVGHIYNIVARNNALVLHIKKSLKITFRFPSLTVFPSLCLHRELVSAWPPEAAPCWTSGGSSCSGSTSWNDKQPPYDQWLVCLVYLSCVWREERQDEDEEIWERLEQCRKTFRNEGKGLGLGDMKAKVGSEETGIVVGRKGTGVNKSGQSLWPSVLREVHSYQTASFSTS